MIDPPNGRAAHAWEQTFDSLHKHFCDGADARCLLWVNAAQFDPFEGFSLVQEHRVRLPIRHPRFDESLAPYLVPLDLAKADDVDVFRASVEKAWLAWTNESLSAFCGQPIAGWVTTQAPTQALAQHWARRCYLHRRRGLTVLLRFHDPGVREWLWPTLSERQRRALLGPADAILAIGRRHTLQEHVKPPNSAEADDIPSLVLEDAQWEQVADYGTVHAAWVTWAAAAEKPINCMAGWERDVLRALGNATRYGIKGKQDRELFALHALQLGADFHTNQRMLPVWERTARGDYYGSALEDIFEHPSDQIHRLFKAAT